MNRAEIKNILPHREPMLLVDEVELIDGKSVGKYTVTGDEFFLQGHFPGNPIVPGVILCEMMGQSSCLLINKQNKSVTPFFTGIKNVKFKQPVVPGDTIVFTCELVRQIGSIYMIKAEGRVNNKLTLSGELSFAVVE